MAHKNNKYAGFKYSLIASSLALAITSSPVLAQDKLTGTVDGTVALESGSVLSNVTVEIKHKGKGITRTVTTGNKGSFSIKALPIGEYIITFKKDGYQTVQQQNIKVVAGNSSSYSVSMLETGVERIEVLGALIRRIDFDNSTTSLTLDASELEKLPVKQDLTSVALLAPGSSLAADPEGHYGRGASFNGSSVAENGYFLNGLNITDIRKGLGYIDIPWDAIAQTSVVTGGVSAEYGHFIGGVTDLVTKSGDNEWRFGVKVDYVPHSFLTENSPDVWGVSTQAADDGSHPFDPQLKINNQEDKHVSKRYNIYASGPIIEDTLFFYAIFNPQKVTDEYADASSTFTLRERDADYWLGKIDWFINDNHSLGFTALNNEWEQDRSVANDYNYQSRSYGELSDPNSSFWGGSLWSVNYTGILTDDLTVSAIYGVTKQESGSINPTAEQSVVWDRRDNWAWDKVGNWVGDYRTNQQDDKRTQFRVDFDWELEDHTISFGYSQEVVETTDDITYAGDGRHYEYRIMSQGTLDWLNGHRAAIGQGPVESIGAGDEYFRARRYSRLGSAESKLFAMYLEDTWRVTDQLTLNLGLRNSSFESYTGEGDKYVDMSNQIAPRLSINYDLFGDGETKVFANYGRYYMPISPNTSVRMTLGETNQYDYATFDAIGGDGLPTNPETMFLLNYGDGSFTQPPSTLVDADLDPMYMDEIAIGFSHELNEDWLLGVRFIYQDLKSSIEDTNMKYALTKWIAENPETNQKIIDDLHWDISSSWVGIVINPGNPVTLAYGDNGESVTWSADYIGLPEAKRKYKGLELTLEGKPADNINIRASYTYSESEGNTEGLVSGVHSQADPGWSGSFDSPEFTDHAYGPTSNDIPHKLKVFGTIDVTDNLNLGISLLAQEGRARNILGYHPQDAGSCADGLDITWCEDWNRQNFYANGQPSPRGAGGYGDWIYNVDFSVNYYTKVADGDLTLSASVYNVFNFDTPTTYNDMTEFDNTIGLKDPNYGNAKSFQAPRSVVLSVRYEF